MTFTQRQPITTALKGPFILTKVPSDLKRHSTRKRFACGYKALAALKSLKLDAARYYGADVCDSNGVLVAELE